jgi:low affinity Fe/Cu permease
MEEGMSKGRQGLGRMFERASTVATSWTGSTPALLSAVSMLAVWLLTGPMFHFSDTWQLVMNTITSIITFVMVFLIQRTQNKDSMAVQLKLNELVAAVQGASNRLIDVEDLSEVELRLLHTYYQRLSEMAGKDEDLGQSHSVEEAQQRHAFKHRARTKRGQLEP